MLTIKQCRKILGKEYKNYTDEQIRAIREFLTHFAQIRIENMKQKDRV